MTYIDERWRLKISLSVRSDTFKARMRSFNHSTSLPAFVGASSSFLPHSAANVSVLVCYCAVNVSSSTLWWWIHVFRSVLISKNFWRRDKGGKVVSFSTRNQEGDEWPKVLLLIWLRILKVIFEQAWRCWRKFLLSTNTRLIASISPFDCVKPVSLP